MNEPEDESLRFPVGSHVVYFEAPGTDGSPADPVHGIVTAIELRPQGWYCYIGDMPFSQEALLPHPA